MKTGWICSICSMICCFNIPSIPNKLENLITALKMSLKIRSSRRLHRLEDLFPD